MIKILGDMMTAHLFLEKSRWNHMKKTVEIETEFITLGQLLKHIDIISSGGMAKWYLSEHAVFLDGEIENRRGKKIFPGSQVDIPDEGTFFIIEAQSEKSKDSTTCI